MTEVLPSPAKRQKRGYKQQPTSDQNGHVSPSQEPISSICGCGKCTINTFLQTGCPKPSSVLQGFLPHLNMDGLSESVQTIRRGNLFLEYKQICSKFATLTAKLLKSLTNRGVSVDNVTQVLQSIPAFNPPQAHTPLLAHQVTSLKDANSLSQLLAFVSTFTSFSNYSLLDQLISKLGSEMDRQDMDDYKSQFAEYGKRGVFECPFFHESKPNTDFCDLVLKVDKEFSKLTVDRLLVFIDWLCSFFMITRASLLLVSISKSENCHVDMVYPQLSKEVEIVCRLSTVVREEILPLSPNQEDLLRSTGVLEVHCGDVHQVMTSGTNSSASMAGSELGAHEYFSNLSMHQAAMLLNPPPTVHDHSPVKNGHGVLRGPYEHGGYMPANSSVGFSQADLASQFLTSRANGPPELLLSRADGPNVSSREDEQPSMEAQGSDGSESEEDQDKPKPQPAPGKKTRGRVKIPMKYIKNKLRRYTTFSKRKSNIMKKAYELSTLTGTQVMLMVASETGHVYTFATPKLQPMITSDAGKALIQTCLHQPDPQPQAPPLTTPPSASANERFDVRMSQSGYEEVDLGGYKLEDQKSDKAPTSLAPLLPLPGFNPDMASLMPVLTSIRPPPLSLSTTEYSHHKDGGSKD